MLLGYNTNGFAHHDPFEAIEAAGRDRLPSVALTLDHGPLNPFAADWPANLQRLKDTLQAAEAAERRSKRAPGSCSIRARKHEPTLVSADAAERQRRIDFLQRAIDAAALLDSDCVSLWSGVRRDDASDEATLERLAESLRAVAAARDRQRRDARLRARAGHVHRHDEVVSAAAAVDRRAAFAAHARRRPPLVPGRDCRSPTTSPAGASGSSTSTSRTCGPASTST